MVMWCSPWLMLVGSRPPLVSIQQSCGHLLADLWWSLALPLVLEMALKGVRYMFSHSLASRNQELPLEW